MAIISHSKKFIFVKTAKSAGTSIEIALSKYCGENDIITQLSKNDEEIRAKLGYRGQQNHLDEKFHHGMSIFEIINYIGDEKFKEYFKITNVRNPWDRTLSYYYWKTKRMWWRPDPNQWIKSADLDLLNIRGSQLFRKENKNYVDFFIRYENLYDDLKKALNTIGIEDDFVLPHAKRSVRKSNKPYQEVWNDDSRKKIADLFPFEIEHFQYEF